MTKPEHMFRSATGADVSKVGALVDATYGHCVERLRIPPRPMTCDYAQGIADQRVTVAESHETVMEVIVLSVGAEDFHVNNVAVPFGHPANLCACANAHQVVSPDPEAAGPAGSGAANLGIVGSKRNE